MKAEHQELNKEYMLIQALKGIFFESPELRLLIEQIVEEKCHKLSHEKRLTPDEMAEAYGVSRSTIDRLSEKELSKLGWEKIYIASLPRFQRIEITEVSKQNLKKAKKR